jgi:hypothetical protein
MATNQKQIAKPQRKIWKSSSEKSRHIASVLDCERGKKMKTLWASVVGRWASISSLHHPTLIDNPNSSSSSLQLNSSHIKVIRKVTFSLAPPIPSFSGIRKVRKFY